MDLLQGLPHGQQRDGVQDLLRLWWCGTTGQPPPGHLRLARLIEVAEPDPGDEPVELCFGKRVGALVLDRVVGGEHHERLRQQVGAAVDADLPLAHRLQQGGLGLGRRAVDLVAEQQVGEHRPGAEHHVPGARVEHGRAGEVGRQHVRGELDPGELKAQRGGERAGEQRLAQPGEVFDEDVARRQDAEQHVRDRRPLADDDPLDLGEDLGTPLGGGAHSGG